MDSASSMLSVGSDAFSLCAGLLGANLLLALLMILLIARFPALAHDVDATGI